MKKNFPLKHQFGGNINGISQKIINELDLTYHNEAELQTPLASYSILGKFKFRTSFNVDEKHKSTERLNPLNS